MVGRNGVMTRSAIFVGFGLSLSACAPGPNGGMFGMGKPPPEIREMMQQVMAERLKLNVFDTNADKEITKAELENGLTAQFAAFDLDHDGVLKFGETQKANERLAVDDPSMPPLRDWNQSGAIEFDEFAAWTRGKFRRTDADEDGTVTQAELTAPPRMPQGPPGGMPPGGMPPGGKPPGGGPPGGGGTPGDGGGMPGGRLSQDVANPMSNAN